ncbi:chorismate-binding protein [Marinilongibacter aquaticus]|uniref:chorismate-binding protein n=1 Tax=Marinilongibacter aquaticus TaxID=2975157 RepID=UPI0021BDAAF3|nr:chorismate-binding protein [Marinilongibacter aquaticus]UBM60127.1 chorismate-binding protein [Marinilongibacter aquaticus]
MQIDAEQNIQKLSFAESFNQLTKGQFPFALWRLPHAAEFECIVSGSPEQKINTDHLDELSSGFLIAPFEKGGQKQTLFISADFYCGLDNLKAQVPFELENRFTQHIENQEFDAQSDGHTPSSTDEKSTFIENVARAVEQIREGRFQKVVLSRQKRISAADFDPIQHFELVCAKYPELFCSLVYLPSERAIWIGASPEVLIKKDADKTFETMALAGTQPAYDEAHNLIACADALWRQKEIEEQALVCRYIINCFKKIRVREYEEIGPRTVKAGNLLHLQTHFKVDAESINFPQIASVMLNLLHPTSAVCGMPKENALAFINQYEPFDRSFYSGFLGPVHINQKSQLFVNLRTMQYSKGEICLFAGCGITVDSDPEKEWAETEMKFRTIMPAQKA